jgi:hypothetical protein
MNQSQWMVTSLEIDNYEGNRNNLTSRTSPTIGDVIEAVKALNGKKQSSFCVAGNDGTVFCVGGGPNGYHVSVTFVDKVFCLCDPTKSDQKVDIIIGSIRTPLPENLIVDQQKVIAAIEMYVMQGTLLPSLNWVEC